MQPLEVVDALDRDAVDRDDQVLGPQAGAGGGAAVDDLDDLDPRVAAELARRAAAAAAASRRRCRGRRGGSGRRSSARDDDVRVASLIGTASPSPTPATAVLIPTTRPRPSASAPPELPGLSAASVWITLSTTRPARSGQRAAERRDDAGGDRAGEAVRVPDRDDELADAEARRRRRARPAARSRASARRTARSESGSAPTTSNSSSLPSTKDARPVPLVLRRRARR